MSRVVLVLMLVVSGCAGLQPAPPQTGMLVPLDPGATATLVADLTAPLQQHHPPAQTHLVMTTDETDTFGTQLATALRSAGYAVHPVAQDRALVVRYLVHPVPPDQVLVRLDVGQTYRLSRLYRHRAQGLVAVTRLSVRQE